MSLDSSLSSPSARMYAHYTEAAPRHAPVLDDETFLRALRAEEGYGCGFTDRGQGEQDLDREVSAAYTNRSHRRLCCHGTTATKCPPPPILSSILRPRYRTESPVLSGTSLLLSPPRLFSTQLSSITLPLSLSLALSLSLPLPSLSLSLRHISSLVSRS
jgi:hypothetical protein